MSKRSAQGPQGDKDSNLFQFNMSSTPDDKPQRATAAQMARRQIKDVRRRPRAGTPTGSSSASFGGPFSSLDPNTVPSPSGGQQPTANGFNFAQSQSFPPASPAPKPPTQNGGSQFAFGSGGPSSFNFSSSFGGTASTPASNPFASINTGGASQQPAANNMSGFKGNLFNSFSAGSQSPAQQSLPSGGLFGAGSQQNGPTGGLFGSNAATSGPSSQSGSTTPANGNIFGQPTTTASSTNVFGQSEASKPNSFAPNASFGSDSMQTSPDAKSSAQKSSPFGSGSGGFGISTNFGGSGTVFGGTSSAPSQTPSKPLFGSKSSEQAAPASPFTFGAASQSAPSTSAAPTSSAAPFTTGPTSSSLFSSSTPKPAAAAATPNPFQSSSLFGAPSTSNTQKSSEEKPKEETKTNQSSFQPSFSSASMSGPSLFSQSASAASNQSSAAPQPVSTGSLFAPKDTSSIGQKNSEPAETNPFSSLFVPKPTATESPKPEQKPLPSTSNMFAPKPASSGGAQTNDLSKAATSASPFTAPSLSQPSMPAPQSPAFSFSNSQATSASAFSAPPASESPLKTNGAKPATPAASASSAPNTSTQSFAKLQPAKMPSGLDKSTKEEVEMAHRVRLLNESFQREIVKLNTSTDSFDKLVQFYIRVRETIGAPIEGASTKRKASVDSPAAIDSPVISTPSNTKPSQLFGTPSASNKRKTTEDDDDSASSQRATEDDDDSASSQRAKRLSGDSTTANIFANSFSRSKTSESEDPAALSPNKLDAPSFRPSTPESAKPDLFSTSTTPKESPFKTVFNTSATPKETPTSTTAAPQTSIFKPSFTAPSSSTPPANPFVLKPSSNTGASTSTAPFAIPKFGSGSGTTDFFAQFKANSDKEAEKEKKKRKADDFDSDEDDEEEWERKDAEAQRKKREEIEAQQRKRAKFIPGQGFSFEETTTTDEEKSEASPSSSVLGSKPNSFGQSSNIFGHLSATPSESGDNEKDDDADDTEEASASGDDAGREPTFASTEDIGTNKSNSKVNGTRESSALESSDEGDFTKALKKSKQATTSDERNSTEQGSGGRSLFDRVEYDQDGKPKRDEKDVSSLFGSSKFASSFNSPGSTPNPFGTSKAQSEKSGDSATPKPAATNIFGASAATVNPFGASPSATPGASTPSIFTTGASTTKPGSDHTWKLNTPIKFASDSTSSSAKSESESGAPANPFSTLFGASSTGSDSGSNDAQKAPGFSFGGPSQAGSSLLTPSVLTSGTPSRGSTPGVTSDTGAEESTDGDAPESLPQVDLARGGAGEEDEDAIFETRARALKLNDGAWQSQGVGFFRILKNRKTSRCRILVRADPSGNVLLNTMLMKEIDYKVEGTNIKFLVPKAEGRPEHWALRFKKGESDDIGAKMEANKS
ncbi:hypothetical protein BDV18DRAFT_134477 [Aspergillus unguis]